MKKPMEEIIKSVAEAIRSFQTLNLLDPQNVKSILKDDEKTNKLMLSVSLSGSEYVMDCCLCELQKLRSNDIAMTVKKNCIQDLGNGLVTFVLTVNFYEQ